MTKPNPNMLQGPPPWLAAPPAIEPTPRWVRVKAGDQWIADSRTALLHRTYGPDGLPTYYLPRDDVQMEALEPAGEADDGRFYWNVRSGGELVERGAWSYPQPPAGLEELEGLISFTWWADPAISWYEEATAVAVHARDPYKRVDAVPSSRHVIVEIDGVQVAETLRPTLLFETHLPTRYYLPLEDVRSELLVVGDASSSCPYKGGARYWSAKVGERLVENVAWSYSEPIPECPNVAGLICFFNERVDLIVDGERLERPWTPWSES